MPPYMGALGANTIDAALRKVDGKPLKRCHADHPVPACLEPTHAHPSAWLCCACLSQPRPARPRSPRRRPQKTKQAIKVETFAKGLVHPWGLAFLPDGRLLVTERPGRVRIVGKDGKLSAPLQGVPTVYASGQGGLLDVAARTRFRHVRR